MDINSLIEKHYNHLNLYAKKILYSGKTSYLLMEESSDILHSFFEYLLSKDNMCSFMSCDDDTFLRVSKVLLRKTLLSKLRYKIREGKRENRWMVEKELEKTQESPLVLGFIDIKDLLKKINNELGSDFLDLFLMIQEDYSTKEMAEALSIHHNSVLYKKNKIKNLLEKNGICSGREKRK